MESLRSHMWGVSVRDGLGWGCAPSAEKPVATHGSNDFPRSRFRFPGSGPWEMMRVLPCVPLLPQIVGSGPCMARTMSLKLLRGIVRFPNVLKIFGIICPHLSCSDPEGTGAPEKTGAQTETYRFPMVFACPPAKSARGHVRPTGDHRGPHVPSLQELLIFQRFTGFGVLCPALSCSVLAPRLDIAENT